MINAKLLLKLLDIKQGEEKTVSLLMVYSFCVGIAYAFLYTTSTSLFLGNFKMNILPYAFIAGGLISYLFWIFYHRMENKLKFTRLLMFGWVFLLVSLTLIITLFLITENKWLAFTLFVWVYVFLFLSSVGFWGIASKIFDLRQGKRLFGLIGSGEILSKIISFFSVPFFLKFMQTKELLFIVIAGLILSLLLLSVIIQKYKSELSAQKSTEILPKNNETKTKHKGIAEILNNKYLKYIFILAMFPLFATYFVDFMFLNETKIQFPNPELVAGFLGIFYGIMSVTEFFIKTFVSGRLINKYGILFSLIILPMVLIFSTASATIYGTFYGATAMFFSFIILSKLFVRVFRTSFLDPSFQILYQPIPASERLAFQSRVEGVPKSVGNIFAGATLILFTNIKSITIVHYNYTLLAVLLAWAWLSYKLYQAYRESLTNMLLNQNKEDLSSYTNDHANVSLLSTLIENGKYQNFTLMYNLLGSIAPRHRNTLLIHIFPTVTPLTQAEILNKFTQSHVTSAINTLAQYLSSNPQSENRAAIEHALSELRKEAKTEINILSELAHSANANERYQAACLLEHSGHYRAHKLLAELLKDADIKVKKAAILSAGNNRKSELWPYLINSISDEEIAIPACAAIEHIGEPILPDLENYFNKAAGNKEVQLRIVRIYSEITGKAVFRFLKSKINFPDQEIRKRVLLALSKKNYSATSAEIPHIKEAVEDEIAMIVWIMATMKDIEEYSETADLQKALQKELEQKKENVLLFLSLIYDSKIIRRIIDAFNDSTHESRTYALEILDLTVSQDIKELFVPLLDDISKEECLKKYADRFPQQKLSIRQRLTDIVNKNYLKINYWTKSCALRQLQNYSETEQDFLAQLLNTTPILRETAIIQLCKTGSKRMNSLLSGISKEQKKTIEDTIRKFEKENGSYLSLAHKADLLLSSSFFSHTPPEVVVKMLEHATEIHLNTEPYKPANQAKDHLFFVIKGQLNITINGRETKVVKENQCFWGIADNKERRTELRASSPALLLEIAPDILYQTMSDNSDCTNEMIRTLCNNN